MTPQSQLNQLNKHYENIFLIESMMLKFRKASAAAGRVCTLAGSASLRAHKTKYALLSVLQYDAAIFQTVSELVKTL